MFFRIYSKVASFFPNESKQERRVESKNENKQINVDEIVSRSVGRLNIEREKILEMTPIELYWAIEAKNEEIDTIVRAVWESTRIQTVYLLNIHLKREHQIRKPEKLFKLKWDEEEAKIEDWREIKNKLLLITKITNKNKNI